MNAIKKFFLKLISDKKNSSKKITTIQNISNSHYVNKQKLFEYWCQKEEWLLFNEGIPLLFSIDPDKKNNINEELFDKIEKLKIHANECVEKKLLNITNCDEPKIKWTIKPTDFFSWATISRVPMPDEFSALMAFITQTVKSKNNLENNNETIKNTHLINREITLGAAISLLINDPASCRKNGNIDSTTIVHKILQNEKHWFYNSKRELADKEMISLIEEYVNFSHSFYKK